MAREHDVGGFQIAMNNAAFMQSVQTVGDLPDQFQGSVGSKRAFPIKQRGQTLALD